MAIHPFRAAFEAQHVSAIAEALAPDVVLRSPAADRPFLGRVLVAELIGAARELLEDFRYTDELDAPETLGLVFRARLEDIEIEGLDLARLDRDGLISELTVMIRPLSAARAFADVMRSRTRCILAKVEGAAASERIVR